MVRFRTERIPFVFSAAIVALLVYSRLLPVKDGKVFSCLCTKDSIKILEGKISSNPVKNMQKGFYTLDFSPFYARDKQGGVYSASGSVKLLLKEEIVEAYFPGKLYSSAKDNSILCEKGNNLFVSGKFSGKYFIAETSRNIATEKNIATFLVKIRSLSRLKFRRLMYYWKDAGGLFLALISGIREYTDTDLQNAFRTAGLSHILALSGMHLSLFSGLSRKISKKHLSEKTSLVLQFVSVLIFVWFAGLSPSLLRAFICNVILIICAAVKLNDIRMLDILSVSFLLHVSVCPKDIFSLAFMLSYGALAGILLFSDFFTLVSLKILPFNIASSFGASCAAQTFTSPIALRTIGNFSPIGIVATIFVSPLITIFIYAGLMIFFLSFFFPFAAPLGASIMNFLYNATKFFVMMFSRFPTFNIGGF